MPSAVNVFEHLDRCFNDRKELAILLIVSPKRVFGYLARDRSQIELSPHPSIPGP
jgi:hypothetical protein